MKLQSNDLRHFNHLQSIVLLFTCLLMIFLLQYGKQSGKANIFKQGSTITFIQIGLSGLTCIGIH